jgi:site-specific recombinase XerD
MNGNQEYEKKDRDRINNLLEKYENYDLLGFYSFISEKSLRTVYVYLNAIIDFLNYTNKSSEDLGLDDFSKYFLHKKVKENGENTTSSYRTTLYHALKNYAEYLVERGTLKKNPMESIKRPKQKESQKTIQKRANSVLNSKELEVYLSTLKGEENLYKMKGYFKERDEAIISILLNTGIRVSSLYKLDVDSVDFEKGTLITTEKGDKVREITLSSLTLNIISEWMDKREELMEEYDGFEPALFISRNKTRLCTDAIARIVKKYGKRLPMKNLSPHKLRATYGTLLYESTGDIYFVQQCMGHSSPATTELYIRNKEDKTKRASDIMEGYLKVGV